MIVQRLLVLVDVKLADIASGPERLKDGPMRGTPAFVCYSGQAGLAHRKELFREAMLENSPTRPPRRMGDFVFSATVQLVLLAVLLLLPLYFSEAIDVHQFNRTLLAAPPPAPAPPPPTATAAIVSGEGVPGGVPGGQPGGVIGGVLSSIVPTAPIDSAPKGPIRIGKGYKEPRVIFGPDPVYPLLARQARVSGAVVIDAVIDTQGNVVEMRAVSGNPLLVMAAMQTLRQWKYEPTIIGGQAFPVRLLVTITFERKDPQG